VVRRIGAGHSHAALSGEHPLRDIERTSLASAIRLASLATDSGRHDRNAPRADRRWQQSFRWRRPASCIVLTNSAFGRVPIDQLTTMPSKQSIMGDRYTLPAGIWNSVMSVSHFSFGALGAEVAVEQVLGCRTDLAHVRAVSTTLARRGNQALLLHQAPHNLLRDVHGLIAQRGLDIRR
jgi:hypothetical protein